jgi:hypothetical protein
MTCPRRPGGGGRRQPRVTVARAHEARRGEERSRDREGMTRGRLWQLEVALGARYRRRAAVAGAAQKGEAARPEEEEAERCQEDLFAISKEFRDPSVN